MGWSGKLTEAEREDEPPGADEPPTVETISDSEAERLGADANPEGIEGWARRPQMAKWDYSHVFRGSLLNADQPGDELLEIIKINPHDATPGAYVTHSIIPPGGDIRMNAEAMHRGSAEGWPEVWGLVAEIMRKFPVQQAGEVERVRANPTDPEQLAADVREFVDTELPDAPTITDCDEMQAAYLGVAEMLRDRQPDPAQESRTNAVGDAVKYAVREFNTAIEESGCGGGDMVMSQFRSAVTRHLRMIGEKADESPILVKDRAEDAIEYGEQVYWGPTYSYQRLLDSLEDIDPGGDCGDIFEQWREYLDVVEKQWDRSVENEKGVVSVPSQKDVRNEATAVGEALLAQTQEMGCIEAVDNPYTGEDLEVPWNILRFTFNRSQSTSDVAADMWFLVVNLFNSKEMYQNRPATPAKFEDEHGSGGVVR